ncbi:37S ribosomal protein S7, mitochondrial [Hypsizygus marmoreus]|uniref:37S ribosomal protein S7, mitochondrial n=1 Tax=Hypsizygus marmoreus TaxID=39966 RepID=A0A369JBB3_HYPMA|nr:37S ribosomal protein S7, mitochondrial [Hypsizygus marmoreus]
MIPSLGLRAARCLPRYTRAISTGGSANDQSIMSEAYSALGLPSGEPTATPPTPAPAPAASSSSSPTSNIMDIPPAEDPLLHYFTSSLVRHGHRAKAARITSETLLHLHAFTRAPPLPILQQAILAASPAVRTLMHRQGGKTVAKPVALGEKQRTKFAVHAILKASENKPGRTVQERLARELIAILQGNSEALKKKIEVHRFAMVNRGNAQTRV